MQPVARGGVEVARGHQEYSLSASPFSVETLGRRTVLDGPGAVAIRHDLRNGREFRLGTAPPLTGAQDHQRRERTHYQRVDKGLQRRHDALPHRFVGTRRGMCNRRRPLPGLARKKRPFHAEDKGGARRSSQESPGAVRRRERATKNQGKRFRNLLVAQNKHHQTAQEVQDNHERHQAGGHLADTQNAADNHQANAHSQRKPAHPRGDSEVALGDIAYIPGLEEVAARHRGNDHRNAENHREHSPCRAELRPAGGQALIHHHHRPSMGILRVFRVAVQHGERDFRQLDRHAEKTNDPHPEHGAGAAQTDRQGHSADIAETDRGGQCGGKGLEMGNGARIVLVVVLSTNDGHAMGQRPVLAEAAPDREQHAGGQHGVQHPVVPNHGVQRIEKIHYIHGGYPSALRRHDIRAKSTAALPPV